MKVAFVHFWTYRLPRGVETLVASLANELARRDVEVSILAARGTRTPLIQPDPCVHVRIYPTFRFYEFATIVPFYAFDLIRNRYDIVIAFFADFGEGPSLRVVSRFVSPRLFLYLTFPYESAPHRYHAYRRWGWDKQAERIFADAEYTAESGQEFFGRKIGILPSGTDPNRFKPDSQKRMALRNQLGFDDGDIVLLNVAALEERKGVWRVIEALPQIKARVPNVRYLVLGEGPQKPQLQSRVKELGLAENVVFAGTTADLTGFYNAADIFVMLSDSEAGSVACLEAMASGLPVVASASGGMREVVDACNGRVVDRMDRAAVVSAVEELAGDRTLRQKLGQTGRERVLEKFSWEKIGERLVQWCQTRSQ